jgi:hypothetical protein
MQNGGGNEAGRFSNLPVLEFHFPMFALVVTFMPSHRYLGIPHFAFFNNHFSIIILNPISVPSVPFVVNPTRAIFS